MIPSDVASRLRSLVPEQLHTPPENQPVTPAQRIGEVLSNLVPGQRILAEIQALLPNGTYRAVVAQREITLALPFSAKAGDTMELEVTQSDGKIALALVTDRSGGANTKTTADSVPTSLSPAGKLIGDLMSGIETAGRRAPPAPLNGSAPLVENMPKSGAELAPLLKQSLTQSGMFYEAHQARWVAGELPTTALKKEPQGQFPAPLPTNNAGFQPLEILHPDSGSGALTTSTSSPFYETTSPPPESPVKTPSMESAEKPSVATDRPLTDNPTPSAKISEHAGSTANQGSSPSLVQTNAGTPNAVANATPNTPTPETQPSTGNPIPRELTTLVQQQLDGLATQNFAWQGQIWPDQQMQWEISDKQDSSHAPDQAQSRQWQTRLKLELPQLGNIDASLRLDSNGQLNISITTDSIDGKARLLDSTEQLRIQLETAGLHLNQLSLQQDEVPE